MDNWTTLVLKMYDTSKLDSKNRFNNICEIILNYIYEGHIDLFLFKEGHIDLYL